MSDLYELPDGWEWKKLDEITKLVGGGTPRRNMNEYWDNGNIIWLSPTDLGRIGEIINISDSKDKITQLGLDKSSAKLLPIGTVLYSSRATIGKIAINTIEVSTNQGFTNFICSEHLNNQYLAYILKRFTNKITSLSNSTTFKEVSKSSLKEFKIPLPALQEQKKIVSKLDTLFEKIDKSITLHQKNMDEADVFMGSVLNDVFGELEQKYQKDNLDNLTKLITKGTTPTTNGYKFLDKGINFLKIENIVNGKINLSTIEMFISEEAHQSQKRSQLEINDVLFSIAGTIGDTAIVKEEHLPMNTNQAVALIRPINKLNPEFLRRLLSSSLSNQTTNKKRGGAIKNVSLGDIKSTIIPVPPLNIQQKTVSYLDEISQKVEKIKSVQKDKMESLVALKASILDQAFRGEL